MRPSRCSYVLGCVMFDHMSSRPFLDWFAWFRCRMRPSICSYVLGCVMFDHMSRRPFLDWFAWLRCRMRPSLCSYVLGCVMSGCMRNRPCLDGVCMGLGVVCDCYDVHNDSGASIQVANEDTAVSSEATQKEYWNNLLLAVRSSAFQTLQFELARISSGDSAMHDMNTNLPAITQYDARSESTRIAP